MYEHNRLDHSPLFFQVKYKCKIVNSLAFKQKNSICSAIELKYTLMPQVYWKSVQN